MNDPPKMVHRSTYVANKLGVTVWAPDKKGIINKSLLGEFTVYSGSDYGEHDGEFIPFTPKPREGNEYG